MNIVDDEWMLCGDMLEVSTSSTSGMLGTPSRTGLRGMFVEPESVIGNESELIVSIEDGIDSFPLIDGLADPRPTIRRSATKESRERERT